MKTKIINKQNIFWIYVIILAVIRFLLIKNLPIIALPDAYADDNLMVDMAINISNGNWLGEYNNFILQKGIMFPLFLVICNILKTPYITGVTLFYVIGLCVFIYSIKDIFKHKLYIYIIYTTLLFNPIMFDSQVIQKVYRNSITQAQVLFIFGCFIAIYLRLKKNIVSIIPWSVMAGLILVTFYNTREDAIWLIPFVATITFINLFVIIKNRKNTTKINLLKRGIVIILPVLLLWVGNNTISAINNYYYGVYLRTEPIGSYFKEAKASIYSVKCNDEIEYVTVTREKLNRLYEVSSTLLAMKPQLEASFDDWSKIDRNPNDNEVEDGWFAWAFRTAVNSYGGYADAQTANLIYKNVHEEIEIAIGKGLLDKRPTMPIASMSPWREEYTSKLFQGLASTTLFTINYNTVSATTHTSAQVGNEGIQKFERLTNNRAIYPMSIRGWFLSFDDESRSSLKIIDANDKIISDVDLLKSEDVYNYFSRKGNIYENAKKCRFTHTVNTILQNTTYYLAVFDDNNNKITQIPFDGSILYKTTDKYAFYIDELTFNTDQINYVEDAISTTKRINNIISIYQKSGLYLAIIGLICYIYICIKFFIQLKKKQYGYLNGLLILTALLLSYVVLIIGVTYANISAFGSVKVLYLSAAYVLVIAFWSIAVSIVCDSIIDIKVLKTKLQMLLKKG